MCELFGISAASPITASYTLMLLAEHGGLTRRNTSGWGVAYYREKDALLFKEKHAAYRSPWFGIVAGSGIPAETMVAHVRRATEGGETYENTHPFSRELGGRAHLFAHNGDFIDFEHRLPLHDGGFLPMGATDSEHAFCYLLNQMDRIWQNGRPSFEARYQVVAEFTNRARIDDSMVNFLYFDGEYLFAHADRREYDMGEGLTEPREPALFVGDRNEVLDAAGVIVDDKETGAVMLASVSHGLGWKALPRGTLIAISHGKVARCENLMTGEDQDWDSSPQ